MLNSKALAFAVGIIWSFVVFITTILATLTGFGKALMETYGSVHPGYSISMTGAFIGLIYGFICAAIGIYLIAWLYNKFEKKFR